MKSLLIVVEVMVATMLKARIFDFSLFFISVLIAFLSRRIFIDIPTYIIALLIYLFFSSLYYHLRIVNKSGNTYFENVISYSVSFAIFTGPLGLFIFETLYRFTVYFTKKVTKTADPEELLDTFYNIGSFVLTNSIAFYLYGYLYPILGQVPFGFWFIMLILVALTSYLSSTFLSITFFISGDIKSLKEALAFVAKSRKLLDIATVTITNSLLLLFLQQENWESLVSLFILNYLVSASFLAKAQNIQNKLERDKFEVMAFTDFLTGIHNRAYMAKRMEELNKTNESVGIVVADIDKFKLINDTYNHAVGDQVIQHFAGELKNHLHSSDALFRSGGEEFTFFLRNRTFEQCLNLTEKINRSLSDADIQVEYQSEPISLHYTASFGLYFFQINENVPMEKGYVSADHLLLQSKQSGRNKVSARNGLV
jgi:diguanylate cyclase (GGDEF)-like protein